MSAAEEEVPTAETNRPPPFFTDPEKARAAGRKGGLARQRQIREAARLTAEGLPEAGEGVERDGRAAAWEVARPQDQAIVSKLQALARKGDVAAARELREWRRLDPARGASADGLRLGELITQLSAANKRELLDWLLLTLREQEVPANGDNREGSVGTKPSVPSASAEREAGCHPREQRDSDAGAPEAPQIPSNSADE